MTKISYLRKLRIMLQCHLTFSPYPNYLHCFQCLPSLFQRHVQSSCMCYIHLDLTSKSLFNLEQHTLESYIHSFIQMTWTSG